MKKNVLNIFLIFLVYACSSVKPKDFTLRYDGKSTDIESKIDIDGCYTFQHECDSSFFSIIMFYNDGLFTIATTSEIEPIIECFANNEKSNICQYPSWGLYTICGDTIKTQTIRTEGIASCTIFRDYIIQADKSLLNISDYVYPQNTKIGYMQNYPSFYENRCKKAAVFHSLKTKRNSTACPFLKSRWFNL